jgi:aryl-alcohol dehydrogenase-like predicted oxidoreductase
MRSAGADGEPSRRYGDTLQLSYNLLDQEAAKGAFVESFRQDWGVISRVPLASGALSGRYGAGHRFPPSDFRAAWSPQRLAETARKVESLRFLEREGRTMAESALAFVLSQEAVSTVIAGAKTAAQVEENARASDSAPLPDEDLRHAQSLCENDFRE